MPSKPEAETISVEEAAQRLGIGRALAYDLVKRNEFPVPVIRLGRRIVIARRAIDKLLDGQ